MKINSRCAGNQQIAGTATFLPCRPAHGLVQHVQLCRRAAGPGQERGGRDGGQGEGGEGGLVQSAARRGPQLSPSRCQKSKLSFFSN